MLFLIRDLLSKRVLNLGLCCIGFAAAGNFLAPLPVSAQALAESDQEQAVEAEKVQQSPSALTRITNEIKYLASDELAGRKPGTPEMKLAEDFIVKAYRDAGLTDPTGTGTYFQTFEVGSEKRIVDGSSSLKITGPEGDPLELKLGEDYSLLLGRGKFDVDSGLAFVGYGISAEETLNYDEYANIDVRGKVVIVLRHEPQREMTDSVFEGENTTKWSFIANKAKAARQAGAKAVLLVNDRLTNEQEGDDLFPADLFGEDNGSLPLMQIHRETLNEMLKVTPIFTATGKKLTTISDVESQIDRELEPLSQTMKGWSVKTAASFETGGIKTHNIVGVLEGEGPHANETIVVGAHYDHLGDGAYGSRARASQRGMIHNGADDNATGTAGVMELARRFAARDKKPGRRIVFICFSAEEMGLLGAYHYVENPTFPLQDTVAMINFDMIGWLRNDEVTLYGWNSAKAFEGMFNAANTDFEFELVKPESGFAGSDHLPFNQKNIPNVFIHTGLTETYHTPDDDFETIDCEGVVKVIDFTEAFMDELCDAEKAPRYLVAGPFRLGINVANNDDDQLVVTMVSANSIAETAGLEEDDIILKWGDDKLDDRRGLRRVIRRDRGETVKLIVLRNGEESEIDLKLVRPGEDDE